MRWLIDWLQIMRLLHARIEPLLNGLGLRYRPCTLLKLHPPLACSIALRRKIVAPGLAVASRISAFLARLAFHRRPGWMSTIHESFWPNYLDFAKCRLDFTLAFLEEYQVFTATVVDPC